MKCPVCESKAEITDIPKRNIYLCPNCEQIFECVLDKTFLMKSAAEIPLSKKGAKAAVSETHVESMKGFVDVCEQITFKSRFETDVALRELHGIIAQAESRITGALSKLTELSMGIEGIEDVVTALEDARSLIAGTGRKYGVKPKDTLHAEG